MERALVAHTPAVGTDAWHLLMDHLQETARLAEAHASAFGIPALGRAAGWLHDLGKASPAFQDYLHACQQAARNGTPPPRSHVDHKSAGALAVAEACPALAFTLLGHHGGLRSPSEVQDLLQRAAANPAVTAVLADGQRLLGAAWPDFTAAAQEMAALAPTDLEADLLIRLLYSCLVDADALDTEAHFDPAAAADRQVSLTPASLWDQLRDDQARLLSEVRETSVNAVRRTVYEDCLRAAALPPGVFTLTVPTGGGKTRSSLAFALAHAVQHGLQRVIYAVPYTSIIEQTAGVFREIFPDPQAVLEHHSAQPEDGETPWTRLAAENWDAPLIVTTTVQLFESLFAHRPGRCRKVHRLAGSVLILDEVQALPAGVLAPIVEALGTLVRRYGTTVVLCTATQPAFAEESGVLRGLPGIREIVTDPAQHFQTMRRVAYRIETAPWTWAQVAGEMTERPQCLTVVNSRKDALALLEALDDPDALHLSTLLCPAHRRAVLAEIRARLDNGTPCRVVATQVIEAGVDVDFPCVLRAAGPLDRIVQAAGRCNREGRQAQGDVIVFFPAEGGMPRGAYCTAFDHAVPLLFTPGVDLHDPALFVPYFQHVFADTALDAQEVQGLRRRLDFPAVAAHFRLIEEDTVPVLVPYDEAGMEALVARIEGQGHARRADWRTAHDWSVAINRRDLEDYARQRLVTEILPGSGLYRWWGGYDSQRGVTDARWDPGDLVV